MSASTAITPAALHRALVDAASARYQPAGRFAYHFARGKLGMDPLFIDLLRLGALQTGGRLLDLGCGQAVLAAWLLAARDAFERGAWPAGWPAPPHLTQLRGLELMPRDVARAQPPFAGEPRVRIEQGDITSAAFGTADAVTLLDVLHYFDEARQDDVLRRVRAALAPGGVLVARVGDAGRGLRFRLSRWVDQAVTVVRGHRVSPLYGHPMPVWVGKLKALGFDVQVAATEGGPPFANTLLIARVPLVHEAAT
ncbi:MAG: class I SAM-dependent methyltransferase [Pseudomonadota bacterium]|nr:class I SAM-dependent methyltransferase [Pseudomonadota bacterium]